MHRQRKRDLNLKPNRVLDKRSSRGMIYENEELRLRTLAIADDVDRGHNDIKKLRRENDHLKREIWTLRDECEKLEDMLKRAMIAGNIDPNDLPYPELVLDFASAEPSLYNSDSRKGSFDGDQDQIIFNLDHDETGTVIEVVPEQHNVPGGQLDFEGHWVVDTSSSTEGYPSNSVKFAPMVGDLETLKEESESTTSQSMGNIVQYLNSQEYLENMQLPDPSLVDLGESTASGAMHLNENPLIQITPASSPSMTVAETPTSPNSQGSRSPQPIDEGGTSPNIQDGGCIAVIPKSFQVTSQIQIQDGFGRMSALPPQSPKKLSTMKIKNLSHCSRASKYDSLHRHTLHGTSPGSRTKGEGVEGESSSCPTPLCYGGRQFCPSCYQSEPSLAKTTGLELPNGLFGKKVTSNLESCECQNVHFNKSSLWWTTGLERQLVLGLLTADTTITPGEIKIPDIVDELEVQFDPSLEKVKGVRVLDKSIFICLKDKESVEEIVKTFGPENGFAIKNSYKIVLYDGSQGYSEVTLSGIGPEVPDSTVIAVLNQYGQVVGGVERKSYKGVEIWERGVRLHLVRRLASHLVIDGYGVQVVSVVSVGTTLIPLPPPPPPPSQSPSSPQTIQSNLTSTTSFTTSLQPPKNKNMEGCQIPVNANLTTDIPNDSYMGSASVLTSGISSRQSPSPKLKEHKPVGRCSSSNPRLESGTASSPIPTKRQTSASICTASVTPEDHPGRLFQKNPNLHKTSAGQKGQGSSTEIPTDGNEVSVPPTKKPLSRLLKSSPVPPGTAVISSVPESNDKGGKSPDPNTQTQSGLRAAFYRGLSAAMDPKSRRGSAISMAPLDNNNIPLVASHHTHNKEFLRRNSSIIYNPRYMQHEMLRQNNSNSSTHSKYDTSVNDGRPREPLPWCACWGNGCV